MINAWYGFRLMRMALCGILSAALLGGCLTSPSEEVRTQSYASMEHVVLLSVSEIENNLVEYHALCGNGRWMKPAKEGQPRQIVWGDQVNARAFRVDAWFDFEPLGAGRTQVTAHYIPSMQQIATAYMTIIVDPSRCQ